MNTTILNKNRFMFFVISVCLTLIAGLRKIEFYRDGENYSQAVNARISILHANFLNKEPLFWVINEINNWLIVGENVIFFLLFAFLGVFIKMHAIRKMSLHPFISIYVYICLYFILHEMTQIRIGVAAGIFLLSLNDIVKRDKKAYFIKVALATLTHYSAVIMLPFYLLNPRKINTNIYLLLPVFAMCFSLFQDFIRVLFFKMADFLPDFIGFKIILYMDLFDQDRFADINVYNFYYMSLIFIYYIFIFGLKNYQSKYDLINIKLLGFSIASFYFFSFLPVMAFRISEFLSVPLILLLPSIVDVFKQKKIIIFFLLSWLTLYFATIQISRNINF